MMMNDKQKGLGLAVLGMAGVLAGRKFAGLAAFGRGVMLLEKEWRTANPDFDGSWNDRWTRAAKFYEATHSETRNRWLHFAGIPLIVAGAGGLFAFKPYRPAWALSAGSFVFGWGLNILGHVAFEKNKPAFAEDPLAFIMGPVWDAKNLFSKQAPAANVAPHAAPFVTTHVVGSA